jgi:pimeloyl-ACP methyl ester carboxylesterase
MSKVQSKYVIVDGLKTHYLEGGQGPALILLHSGEFGGCAEITWEFNIDALAEHFHVYAPDWLGYGRSAKVFSFEDMWDMRVQHIRRFMETLCIDHAHFMGNSMGGSTLITAAAMDEPPWNMDKIVIVSGGGEAPDNETRKLLNTYDCTLEHMQRIVRGLFLRPEIRDSADYARRRHEVALEPGAWECTAAVRFKSPVAQVKSAKRPSSYRGVKSPTLIVAGAQDNLRHPGYAQALQEQIPGASLFLMDQAGHCPQIDGPEQFNQAVIDFLREA